MIEGGHSLEGNVHPQGAKNEALQVLCATLLTDQAIRIENLPQIQDVLLLIALLRDLGVDVEQLDGRSYRFQARQVRLRLIRRGYPKAFIKTR